jgi:hypothetical protein
MTNVYSHLYRHRLLRHRMAFACIKSRQKERGGWVEGTRGGRRGEGRSGGRGSESWWLGKTRAHWEKIEIARFQEGLLIAAGLSYIMIYYTSTCIYISKSIKFIFTYFSAHLCTSYCGRPALHCLIYYIFGYLFWKWLGLGYQIYVIPISAHICLWTCWYYATCVCVWCVCVCVCVCVYRCVCVCLCVCVFTHSHWRQQARKRSQSPDPLRDMSIGHMSLTASIIYVSRHTLSVCTCTVIVFVLVPCACVGVCRLGLCVRNSLSLSVSLSVRGLALRVWKFVHACLREFMRTDDVVHVRESVRVCKPAFPVCLVWVSVSFPWFLEKLTHTHTHKTYTFSESHSLDSVGMIPFHTNTAIGSFSDMWGRKCVPSLYVYGVGSSHYVALALFLHRWLHVVGKAAHIPWVGNEEGRKSGTGWGGEGEECSRMLLFVFHKLLEPQPRQQESREEPKGNLR